MLRLLHIENIAVIERADIEFGEGFNVLTGETGAGKSIVIDALNAVTGSRTSKELVRTGAPFASASALFTSDAASQWCEENGISPDEDGAFLLMRKITPDGKNTCRVNGSPVTVAQLRELGSLLLDVHGQNDGRRLMDEASHRGYLDSFAGLAEKLDEYSVSYKAYKAKKAEMEALDMDESEKARRIDMLRFQIAELERAELCEGEYDELSERRELLKNASRLKGDVDAAFYALDGGLNDSGASTLISEAEGALIGASRYAAALAELLPRVKELRFAVQDIAEELRDFRDTLDFSPHELDELDSRLDTIKRTVRKYGGTEESCIEYLDKIRAELNEIEFSSDKLEMLEKDCARLLSAASAKASELTALRKRAASELEKRVITELSDLNMKGTRFSVDIIPTDELTSTGTDNVRFMISANAGEAPGRISKIASGGELSRIMLAMKNVLSEGEEAGTLVFDEIDTGVSGIAAQRVGEKLGDLARSKQVLCVTHLPQIAVMADEHFEIEKCVENDRTFTRVTHLELEGRTREIARLTGGENITELTLASATELIKAAQAYKISNRDQKE